MRCDNFYNEYNCLCCTNSLMARLLWASVKVLDSQFLWRLSADLKLLKILILMHCRLGDLIRKLIQAGRQYAADHCWILIDLLHLNNIAECLIPLHPVL